MGYRRDFSVLPSSPPWVTHSPALSFQNHPRWPAWLQARSPSRTKQPAHCYRKHLLLPELLQNFVVRNISCSCMSSPSLSRCKKWQPGRKTKSWEVVWGQIVSVVWMSWSQRHLMPEHWISLNSSIVSARQKRYLGPVPKTHITFHPPWVKRWFSQMMHAICISEG